MIRGLGKQPTLTWFLQVSSRTIGKFWVPRRWGIDVKRKRHQGEDRAKEEVKNTKDIDKTGGLFFSAMTVGEGKE